MLRGPRLPETHPTHPRGICPCRCATTRTCLRGAPSSAPTTCRYGTAGVPPDRAPAVGAHSHRVAAGLRCCPQLLPSAAVASLLQAPTQPASAVPLARAPPPSPPHTQKQNKNSPQSLELRLPNRVPWLLERAGPFQRVGLDRFLVQPPGGWSEGLSAGWQILLGMPLLAERVSTESPLARMFFLQLSCQVLKGSVSHNALPLRLAPSLQAWQRGRRRRCTSWRSPLLPLRVGCWGLRRVEAGLGAAHRCCLQLCSAAGVGLRLACGSFQLPRPVAPAVHPRFLLCSLTQP
jgi:hypothetical protein